ncbi:MAG TPA: site-2 protease family protein [Anaeromyxobacteraceae bacterium]
MGFDLLAGVKILIPLVLSLTVHEFAHAWSAWRLGDDTASRMGRLTLNPLAHIDPIGTFLLPLLGIPFGWAKPVPVNPARFRRGVSMGTGMMITAAAGPLSNVVLAVLCTVGYGLLLRFAPDAASPGSGTPELLLIMIKLNVALAIFNMIPVPPLDGSRVVDGLMPVRLRPAWEGFTRFAPFLLVGVFIGARYIMAGPMGAVYGLLERLLNVVVGA